MKTPLAAWKRWQDYRDARKLRKAIQRARAESDEAWEALHVRLKRSAEKLRDEREKRSELEADHARQMAALELKLEEAARERRLLEVDKACLQSTVEQLEGRLQKMQEFDLAEASIAQSRAIAAAGQANSVGG